MVDTFEIEEGLTALEFIKMSPDGGLLSRKITSISLKFPISLINNKSEYFDMEFFKQTASRILWFVNHDNELVRKAARTFFKHWFNLIVGFSPDVFIRFVSLYLQSFDLCQQMHVFLGPLALAMSKIQDGNNINNTEMFKKIYEQIPDQYLDQIPENAWETIFLNIEKDEIFKRAKSCFNPSVVALICNKYPEMIVEAGLGKNRRLKFISKFIEELKPCVFDLTEIINRAKNTINSINETQNLVDIFMNLSVVFTRKLTEEEVNSFITVVATLSERRLDDLSFHACLSILGLPARSSPPLERMKIEIKYMQKGGKGREQDIVSILDEAKENPVMYNQLYKLASDVVPELIKPVKIHMNEIDWFNFDPSIINKIEKIDPHVLVEMLGYHMIAPISISYIIDKINEYPEECAEVAYPKCKDLFLSYAKELGYSIEPLKIDSEGDHLWLPHDLLTKLLFHANEPFEVSTTGRIIKSTIVSATKMFKLVERDDKTWAELAIIASRMVCFFPTECLNLINAIVSEFPQNDKNKYASLAHEAASVVFSEHLPFSAAPALMRLAINEYGVDGAINKVPELIFAASNSDREIALKLEKKLAEKEVNTFLVFAKTRKEYCQRCAENIPVEKWIIEEEDREFIETLPDGEKKTFALNVLDSRKKNDDEKNVEEKHYTFDESCLKPKEGISFGNRNYLYDLTSFLWHSKLDLPESLNFKEIEVLAMEDTKLAIGFFAYAQKKNIKIMADAWAEKLKLEDDNDVLAAAMFFRCIKVEETNSDNVMTFAERCCKFLGGELKPEFIAHATKYLRDEKQLLARSIMNSYPQLFADNQLLMSEITGTPDRIAGYVALFDAETTRQQFVDAMIAIINVCFKPDIKELVQRHNWPSNVTYPTECYSYRTLNTIQEPQSIPSDLNTALVSIITKNIEPPFGYFTLLSNIKHGRLQAIACDALTLMHDSSKTELPALLFRKYRVFGISRIPDDAGEEFQNRAPSFTRSFLRSIISPLSPPIPQSNINDIIAHLTPVHPALAYEKVKPSEKPLLISAIQGSTTGFYSDNEVYEELKGANFECLSTLESLLESVLHNEFGPNHIVSKDFSCNEAAKNMLMFCTKEPRGLLIASDLFDVILSNIGVDRGIALICNKDFMCQPDFQTVAILFRRLRRLCQPITSETARINEFVEKELPKFLSEEKRKFLESPTFEGAIELNE